MKFTKPVSLELTMLLEQLLNKNPKKRPSAKGVLNHQFFVSLRNKDDLFFNENHRSNFTSCSMQKVFKKSNFQQLMPKILSEDDEVLTGVSPVNHSEESKNKTSTSPPEPELTRINTIEASTEEKILEFQIASQHPEEILEIPEEEQPETPHIKASMNLNEVFGEENQNRASKKSAFNDNGCEKPFSSVIGNPNLPNISSRLNQSMIDQPGEVQKEVLYFKRPVSPQTKREKRKKEVRDGSEFWLKRQQSGKQEQVKPETDDKIQVDQHNIPDEHQFCSNHIENPFNSPVSVRAPVNSSHDFDNDDFDREREENHLEISEIVDRQAPPPSLLPGNYGHPSQSTPTKNPFAQSINEQQRLFGILKNADVEISPNKTPEGQKSPPPELAQGAIDLSDFTPRKRRLSFLCNDNFKNEFQIQQNYSDYMNQSVGHIPREELEEALPNNPKPAGWYRKTTMPVPSIVTSQTYNVPEEIPPQPFNPTDYVNGGPSTALVGGAVPSKVSSNAPSELNGLPSRGLGGGPLSNRLINSPGARLQESQVLDTPMDRPYLKEGPASTPNQKVIMAGGLTLTQPMSTSIIPPSLIPKSSKRPSKQINTLSNSQVSQLQQNSFGSRSHTSN